jgi:hypothetical protein
MISALVFWSLGLAQRFPIYLVHQALQWKLIPTLVMEGMDGGTPLSLSVFFIRR